MFYVIELNNTDDVVNWYNIDLHNTAQCAQFGLQDLAKKLKIHPEQFEKGATVKTVNGSIQRWFKIMDYIGPLLAVGSVYPSLFGDVEIKRYFTIPFFKIYYCLVQGPQGTVFSGFATQQSILNHLNGTEALQG